MLTKMEQEQCNEPLIFLQQELRATNLDYKCRLCVKQSDDLIAIFSKEGRSKGLEQKINLYLPIKVSERDELPLQCCSECTSTILAWHDLVIASIEADTTLRRHKLTNIVRTVIEEVYEGDEESNSEKYLDAGSNSEKCCVNIENQNEEQKQMYVNESAISNFEQSKLCFICYNCNQMFFLKRDLIAHLNKSHEKIYSEKDMKNDESSRSQVIFNIGSLSLINKIEHLKSSSASDEDFDRENKDESLMVEDIKQQSDKNIDTNIKENHFKIEQSEINELLIMKTKEKLEEAPSSCRNESKKLSRDDIEKLIDPTTKSCKLCLMKFKMKIDLKRHLFSVHNIKEQKLRRKHSEIEAAVFCDICDKGFTRKYDMLKHRKARHKEVKDDFDVGNSARKQLVKQSKMKDEEGKSVYKCEFCSHIFKLSENLLQHRHIHTGEKPYFCDLCGKNFTSKTGLNRHVNECHHCIKKYKCDVCDKVFKTRATRDDHMNIHTDTRPYVCDVCGKAFRQKASLHVHKTYHTNNFRFSCDICGTKYRRAQELKVHNRIHTGDKPYKCYICNSYFRWGYDLKRHMKTHNTK